MKKYKIESTILMEYEVEAENKEGALDRVLSGELEPTRSTTLNDEVFEDERR